MLLKPLLVRWIDFLPLGLRDFSATRGIGIDCHGAQTQTLFPISLEPSLEILALLFPLPQFRGFKYPTRPSGFLEFSDKPVLLGLSRRL